MEEKKTDEFTNVTETGRSMVHQFSKRVKEKTCGTCDANTLEIVSMDTDTALVRCTTCGNTTEIGLASSDVIALGLKRDSWEWMFKVLHGQRKGLEAPIGEHSLGNFWAIIHHLEDQYYQKKTSENTWEEF